MTPEERTTQLDVLQSLDFGTLPDEAVLFLLDYLLHPAARSKLGALLSEMQRLHAKEYLDSGDHFEHVEHRPLVRSFLIARPNGEGGVRVVSNISLDHLSDYVGDYASRWASSARVGEFYNTEGTYVLVRTS
jgi:hypothetical protein